MSSHIFENSDFEAVYDAFGTELLPTGLVKSIHDKNISISDWNSLVQYVSALYKDVSRLYTNLTTVDTMFATPIESSGIADGAVVTRTLADKAVTVDKIADDAVTTTAVKDRAITLNKLAVGSVDDSKIVDNVINSRKIKNGSVITAKLADKAVTTEKIDDAAITVAKLVNNAVTTDKIADAAVTSKKILNDAITETKIANESIRHRHLGHSSTYGYNISPQEIRGSALPSLDDDAKVHILASSIGTQDIALGSITNALIAPGAVTSGKIYKGTVTLEKLHKDVQNILAKAFTSVSYNSETGVLRFGTSSATPTVNVALPLEMVVSAGRYDPDSHEIVLTLSTGDELSIPLDELTSSVLEETQNKYNEHSAEVAAKLSEMQEQIDAFNGILAAIEDTLDAVIALQDKLIGDDV